jgi:hypothetical protein
MNTFDCRRARKRQRHCALAIRLLKVSRQSGRITKQNFELRLQLDDPSFD